jgi:hypothetical protein
MTDIKIKTLFEKNDFSSTIGYFLLLFCVQNGYIFIQLIIIFQKINEIKNINNIKLQSPLCALSF